MSDPSKIVTSFIKIKVDYYLKKKSLAFPLYHSNSLHNYICKIHAIKM